jgi:hypothetical protein
MIPFFGLVPLTVPHSKIEGLWAAIDDYKTTLHFEYTIICGTSTYIGCEIDREGLLRGHVKNVMRWLYWYMSFLIHGQKYMYMYVWEPMILNTESYSWEPFVVLGILGPIQVKSVLFSMSSTVISVSKSIWSACEGCK